MTTENQKFKIARVLMGAPYFITQSDGLNVPVILARVIVENGGIYSRVFYALGCTTDTVREAWDKEHEKFLKVDPAAKESEAS
jgi:hypothetical protein